MAEWDKGAYGKVILNGDIHTANQEAAGLELRAKPRPLSMDWLYGAGSAKIGTL